NPGYTTLYPETGMTPVSASVSGLVDDHYHAPGWTKPYVFKVVASDQQYQFQCPYYLNNQWIPMMPVTGTIPITRVVNLNGPAWYYQITKSGLSPSVALP